jgi:hypothetical protein
MAAVRLALISFQSEIDERCDHLEQRENGQQNNPPRLPIIIGEPLQRLLPRIHVPAEIHVLHIGLRNRQKLRVKKAASGPTQSEESRSKAPLHETGQNPGGEGRANADYENNSEESLPSFTDLLTRHELAHNEPCLGLC